LPSARLTNFASEFPCKNYTSAFVGGEGNRGGLISVVLGGDDDNNLIQWLSSVNLVGKKDPASDECDRKRAHVLEKIRDFNLLKKADRRI